jgi:hypothetical protein
MQNALRRIARLAFIRPDKTSTENSGFFSKA